MKNKEKMKGLDVGALMEIIKKKGFSKLERSEAAKEIWARRSKDEKKIIVKKAVENRFKNNVLLFNKKEKINPDLRKEIENVILILFEIRRAI